MRSSSPRVVILVLVLTMACSKIAGFDDLERVGATSDGGGDSTVGAADGGTSDTSDVGDSQAGDGGPVACALTTPFAAPVPLPGIAVGADVESALTLSGDELTIIFQRGPDALDSSLFIATRASRSEPFGEARRMTELSATNPFDPTLSADGFTLIFGADRGSPPNSDLFLGTRSSATARFAVVGPILPTSTSSDEFAPTITANGSELWFGRGTRLFQSSLQGTTVGPPVAALEPEVEREVCFSPDRSVAYFPITRIGTSDSDLWFSVRTQGGTYGPAALVPNVNSPAREEGPWISGDACRIYFVSERGGDKSHIWVAERSPP